MVDVLFGGNREVEESVLFDPHLHPRDRKGEFAHKFGVFKHPTGVGHVVRSMENGRAASPYHEIEPVSTHETERQAHVAANGLNGVVLPPPAPRFEHPEGHQLQVGGMHLSVPVRPSIESGGPREDIGFQPKDRVVLADGREGNILGPGRRHPDGEVTYSVHTAVKRVDPAKTWKTTEQVTAKHSELSYHPEVMAERRARADEIMAKVEKGGMPLGRAHEYSRPVTLGPHVVPADWQVEHGYAEYISGSMHRNPSEGDEVAVMPNAPEHGGKRGVVVQATDKDPVTGFYRGGAEHPGSQVNPLVRFEGEQEPVAVRSRDLYRGTEKAPPTRLKPGTDVERMIFHHMAGRPAPANPAPGTTAYEQWTYGMKGKGSTKRPGNKADRAALISKLTQAANASDSTERGRALMEAERLLRELPHLGLTEADIEIIEAAHVEESLLLASPRMRNGRTMSTHWNPSEHPRGRHGQFAEVLSHMGRGHEAVLPHGVRVKRSALGGFRVHGPNDRTAHSFDAEKASKTAHEFSADAGRASGDSHRVGPHAWRTGREHMIDDMWRPGDGGDAPDVLGRAAAAHRAVANPGLADSGPELDDAARERIAAQGREADAKIERFKAARRAAGVPSSVSARRGSSAKVQALIDSGLATDEADARAQLADMGEMGRPGSGEFTHRGQPFGWHGDVKTGSPSIVQDYDPAAALRARRDAMVPGSPEHVQATAALAGMARSSAIMPSPAMRRTNERLAQLREIVRSHQHQEIGGVLVDTQTANLLLKVYGALNERNRESFGTVPIDRLARFAYSRAH
jgi:hypothetical protein